MGILATLRDTLRPSNTNEVWGLVGFFLFIFIVWCIRSGDNKGKKPGFIKASIIALIILAIINFVIEAIF